MRTSKCGTTGCGKQKATLQVTTDVPDTAPTVVTKCPACDTRRCDHPGCTVLVLDPTARKCPLGHAL